MELILVRHGQPAWSTPDGRGRNDPGLTELGHAQAAAVAARLADPAHEPAPGPVDRLLVSTAVRARETCAPIEAALDMDAELHPWLHEINNPHAWEGAPLEHIDAAFRELRGRPRAEMWNGIAGMEPLHDFHERVLGGLHGFLREVGVLPDGEPGLWQVADDAPTRVVAVAHGGTNSTIIAHLLGIRPEPWEWDRFVMGHASVAILATSPLAGANLWSLRALGDANHLALDDRTL